MCLGGEWVGGGTRQPAGQQKSCCPAWVGGGFSWNSMYNGRLWRLLLDLFSATPQMILCSTPANGKRLWHIDNDVFHFNVKKNEAVKMMTQCHRLSFLYVEADTTAPNPCLSFPHRWRQLCRRKLSKDSELICRFRSSGFISATSASQTDVWHSWISADGLHVHTVSQESI